MPRSLLVAILALAAAAPLRAQVPPPDLGPLLAEPADSPFVGMWLAVDDPSATATVYRHERDGGLLRLRGSLDSETYRVVGDSVTRAGGVGALLAPRGATVGFRIRGDSLWFHVDEVARTRFGAPPPGADDPLEGDWMYVRHGRLYLEQFARDGRVVRWQVEGGGPRWEVAGDTVTIGEGGIERRSFWRVTGDLLVISKEGGRDARRFVRIDDLAAIDVPNGATIDPTVVPCASIQAVAQQSLDEGRIGTVATLDPGIWGYYDYGEAGFRLSKPIMPEARIVAHTTAHLAAHALGYGATPDVEWVAEEVARRCVD